MKIKDILTKNKQSGVITISKRNTIHETARLLCEKKIGAVPVLDGKGTLIGIISERDILKECAERP